VARGCLNIVGALAVPHASDVSPRQGPLPPPGVTGSYSPLVGRELVQVGLCESENCYALLSVVRLGRG
jgi:hypothetical protein